MLRSLVAAILVGIPAVLTAQTTALDAKSKADLLATRGLAGRGSNSLWAKKNGRFWLTMLRGEAYIQRIGASSANGAIAPPGAYMLFVVSSEPNPIPSHARYVIIGD